MIMYDKHMNLITVSISEFRNKLSDYLTLVNLGKAVVSLKNAKSGKEIARLVNVTEERGTIEKRVLELFQLAGFAAKYPLKARKKFTKMEKDYINKLKTGKIK